jgi:hypothetical protein
MGFQCDSHDDDDDDDDDMNLDDPPAFLVALRKRLLTTFTDLGLTCATMQALNLPCGIRTFKTYANIGRINQKRKIKKRKPT